MQHLQLLAALRAGFDGAVQHDQAGAGRGLRQDAFFRDIGDGPGALAAVMHQYAVDFALAAQLADEDGEALLGGVEFPFIDQGARHVGADVHHLVAQRPLPRRHQIQDAGIGQHHHDGGASQHRHGQLAQRIAGRGHGDQLAVALQPLQGDQGGEIESQRHDDRQQGGQDQKHQIQKGERRLAAIDHQVQVRQAVDQPDHARQKQGQQRHRSQQLHQDIEGQARQPRAARRLADFRCVGVQLSHGLSRPMLEAGWIRPKLSSELGFSPQIPCPCPEI